jgi:hypothetical protein
MSKPLNPIEELQERVRVLESRVEEIWQHAALSVPPLVDESAEVVHFYRSEPTQPGYAIVWCGEAKPRRYTSDYTDITCNDCAEAYHRARFENAKPRDVDPREHMPLIVAELPDAWNAQRTREGKTHLIYCAAELRRALAHEAEQQAERDREHAAYRERVRKLCEAFDAWCAAAPENDSEPFEASCDAREALWDVHPAAGANHAEHPADEEASDGAHITAQGGDDIEWTTEDDVHFARLGGLALIADNGGDWSVADADGDVPLIHGSTRDGIHAAKDDAEHAARAIEAYATRRRATLDARTLEWALAQIEGMPIGRDLRVVAERMAALIAGAKR